MNLSTVQHMNNHEVYLLFKGAFLWLAPLTIPLSLIVLVQNTVVFINYYRDRSKLVAGLFMGIAVADLLKAQGELVLSVVGILVYSGVYEVTVLYKSLFYYMITALPGINWSKLFNLVMTITLTAKVVDPFRTINISRIRKVVGIASVIIALLHMTDVLTINVIALKYDYASDDLRIYLHMMMGFAVPGFASALSLICMPDHSGATICDLSHATTTQLLLYITGFLYCIGIPLTILICMIIQIKHLKNSLRESAAVSSLPNAARHVTITVLWVSVLFFICNAVFFFIVLVGGILHLLNGKTLHTDQMYVNMGMLLGFCEFTLPLIYAVVYPVILICRKQELRERYRGYCRQIFFCC